MTAERAWSRGWRYASGVNRFRKWGYKKFIREIFRGVRILFRFFEHAANKNNVFAWSPIIVAPVSRTFERSTGFHNLKQISRRFYSLKLLITCIARFYFAGTHAKIVRVVFILLLRWRSSAKRGKGGGGCKFEKDQW